MHLWHLYGRLHEISYSPIFGKYPGVGTLTLISASRAKSPAPDQLAVPSSAGPTTSLYLAIWKSLTQKPTYPNHQEQRAAFETHNGRSALAAGTALRATADLDVGRKQPAMLGDGMDAPGASTSLFAITDGPGPCITVPHLSQPNFRGTL